MPAATAPVAMAAKPTAARYCVDAVLRRLGIDRFGVSNSNPHLRIGDGFVCGEVIEVPRSRPMQLR
jgi:hypothetical protein